MGPYENSYWFLPAVGVLLLEITPQLSLGTLATRLMLAGPGVHGPILIKLKNKTNACTLLIQVRNYNSLLYIHLET